MKTDSSKRPVDLFLILVVVLGGAYMLYTLVNNRAKPPEVAETDIQQQEPAAPQPQAAQAPVAQATPFVPSPPLFVDDAAATLRIGTEGEFPPFNSVGPDGRPVGFDIDVMSEICRRLNERCKFDVLGWTKLFPSLYSKKNDVLIAAISITDERKKSMAFSEPYYTSKSYWVGPAKGAITTLSAESIKGKRIGASRGTAQLDYVRKFYSSVAQVIVIPEAGQLLPALKHGQVDLALVGGALVRQWTGQGLKIFGLAREDHQTLGQGTGIAVRTEDVETLRKINQALQSMKADGTLKRLEDLYFPEINL